MSFSPVLAIAESFEDILAYEADAARCPEDAEYFLGKADNAWYDIEDNIARLKAAAKS